MVEIMLWCAGTLAVPMILQFLICVKTKKKVLRFIVLIMPVAAVIYGIRVFCEPLGMFGGLGQLAGLGAFILAALALAGYGIGTFAAYIYSKNKG